MTDENEHSAPADAPSPARDRDAVAEKLLRFQGDFQLKRLVGLAERSAARHRAGKGAEGLDAPVRWPVTLTVSGVVVTGTLVGFHEWAEAVVEEVTFGDDEDSLELRDAMRQFFGVDTSDPDEDTLLAEMDDLERMTVHLIDARVGMGGAMVPANRPFAWRGRISEISGWSLGILTSEG